MLICNWKVPKVLKAKLQGNKMNYSQTLEFLYSQLPAYHRIGKAAYKNDLHNSLAFDDYLGRPHSRYRTIHVAGTNGKGSVSHMIASVLMEAGFKTGLYTSPHLKDFRERIKVNGKMIPKRAVTGFVERHSAFIRSLEPSFFEMTVAMAFDYFADAGIDMAVIEAGLGGRLDSTNIINPVLTVITNIGHDHMDLLGDTLEKVAGEKAGIIKQGVPVVVGETMEETKDVFIRKAEEKDSKIFFADQNYSCILGDTGYQTGRRIYNVRDKISGRSIKGETGLVGDYQVKNIQTVFQAFRVLKEVITNDDKIIQQGILKVVTNTGLLGRWQIIARKPLIICDTGHNKEGLEYVVNQLAKIKNNRLHIVLGFVSDKDLSAILPLFPGKATYYFTKASVPRALDEKILMAEAAQWNLKGTSFPDVPTAVKAARANASDSDLIFIGGSTFVVADAL
ncbi:MAG: tetrahydrofolate synthase [Bacteroidetes bacterium]|nr:tetrahydrofolate synthase [Bacteroidota bacterium]